MAHALRRSTRKTKPKSDPDFLYADIERQLLEAGLEEMSLSPPPQGTTTRSTPRQDQQFNQQASPRPTTGHIPSPVSDRTRLAEAERDKLALELELIKLKTSITQRGLQLSDPTQDETTKKQQRKKKVIDWPNEFCSGAASTEFERLDMPDFVAGYLAMIKPYEPQHKDVMLQLLELVMLKSCSYSWKSVRTFYAHLARQVELCRLEFQDQAVIRDLATIHFKHSDLRSAYQPRDPRDTKPNVSTSSTFIPDKATTPKACRQWNYTGQCKCDSSSTTFAGHHKCRVCAKDHPMLHCSKRRSAIPDITQNPNDTV